MSTKEFDPILELATKFDGQDKLLFAVDDEGSEARFAFRLPEKGEYKIQIHAFKYKGGGNYSLRIRRFQATPLVVGTRLIGTIDQTGKRHHYFQGKEDQILIPELKGASSRSWEMIDVKGRQMSHWSGTVRIENDGVHSLVVSGRAGNRYEILIRESHQRTLDEGKKLIGRLDQREMDVWSFEGEPGEFRLLEVNTKGQLLSRLIYAPRQKKDLRRIARAGSRPEIQFMPVGSKGGRLRIAAVLGRRGRYQLQLLAETPATYDLQMGDSAKPIDYGQEFDGSLPIGGSTFYRFQAMPGQLFQASLVSDRFDPLFRLYNSRGDLVQQNDDGDGGVGSRITHMVMTKDLYRLQVSSLGNGGAGNYHVALHELKLKTLDVGGRGAGTLNSNSTDYWSFSGTEGTTVLLSVSSSVCDPMVRLYNPDGVHLGSDDNNGVGTDSLLAVRLPKTGRYTVSIASQRGAGNYTLRLIDGD